MDSINNNLNELKPGTKRENFVSKPENSNKNLLIFDIVDTNKDGVLSENEINTYNQTMDRTNWEVANPKMQNKIEKLNQKIDKIFEDINKLTDEIIVLEKYRNSLDKETNPKEFEDVEKLINTKYNEHKKLSAKYDKYNAQRLFLSEVKVDNNLSEKDINTNAQMYINQRNQLNPYYKKYKEVQIQYDLETDKNKKNELWQQFTVLDQLVANWRPEQVNFKPIQQGTNLNLSTDIKTNLDDTTESFNLGLNTKIKNHNLNLNSNAAFTQSEETGNTSKNIYASIDDNIEIGEKSNLNISSSYSNYISNSESGNSQNQTITNQIGGNTKLGNVSLNASYQNQYSISDFSNQDFENTSTSMKHTGNIGFNQQIKKFSYGTGFNISNSSSEGSKQTLYSTPINLNYNALSNEHNQLQIGANYTPTWGKDYNSSAYTTNINYNYSNNNINLNNSTYFNYTKGNLNGESFSYNNTTTLINKKYGFSTSLNFTGSNSKYSDMYDTSLSFSTPMTNVSNLKIAAGYNSETGGYGSVGVSFNINLKNKKNHD